MANGSLWGFVRGVVRTWFARMGEGRQGRGWFGAFRSKRGGKGLSRCGRIRDRTVGQ